MPRKEDLIGQWITSKEAAEILTKNSGHTVSDNYVRRMGKTGLITVKEIDGRTRLYLKSDIETYTVKKRGDGSIRVAAGHPRRTRLDEPGEPLSTDR